MRSSGGAAISADLSRLLDWVTSGSALVSLVLIVTLHTLPTELRERGPWFAHCFISEFAREKRYGWLMQTAFALVAVCALSLAVSAAAGTWLTGPARIGFALALGVAFLGAVTMLVNKSDFAVIGADRTDEGRRHDTAAIVTFVAALTGMGFAMTGARPDPLLSVLALAAAAAFLALLCLAVWPMRIRPRLRRRQGAAALVEVGAPLYPWAGIPQRILIICLLAWCVRFTWAEL